MKGEGVAALSEGSVPYPLIIGGNEDSGLVPADHEPIGGSVPTIEEFRRSSSRNLFKSANNDEGTFGDAGGRGLDPPLGGPTFSHI